MKKVALSIINMGGLAKPTQEPAMTLDGFLKLPGAEVHDGGEQPLKDLVMVDYLLVNGGRGTALADSLYWHHDGRGDDIMAFREVQP